MNDALEFLAGLSVPMQIAITISCAALAGALAYWSWANWPAPRRPRGREVATAEVDRQSADGLVPVPSVPDPDVGNAATAHLPVAHTGADVDWSPRRWLDECSDPTDPGIGPVAVNADAGRVPTATAEGAALSAELDAIMGRFRRELEGWADEVTFRHPWLLDSWSWQSQGLGWGDEFLGLPMPERVVSAGLPADWAPDLIDLATGAAYEMTGVAA